MKHLKIQEGRMCLCLSVFGEKKLKYGQMQQSFTEKQYLELVKGPDFRHQRNKRHTLH